MAGIPGATTLPTNLFEGDDFKDAVNNEKRALLAAIAEHGSAGAQAFEQAKQDALATRAKSNEKAAARGAAIHAPEALQTIIAQKYDELIAPLTDARTGAAISHGRELDRLAAANAAFMDQTAAAGILQKQALDAELAQAQAQASGGGGSRSGSDSSGLLDDFGADGQFTLAELMQISNEEGLTDAEAVQLARDVGAPAEWEDTLFNNRNPAQDPEGLAPLSRGQRSRGTSPIRGGRAGAPKIPTFDGPTRKPAGSLRRPGFTSSSRSSASKARQAAIARRKKNVPTRFQAGPQRQSTTAKAARPGRFQ